MFMSAYNSNSSNTVKDEQPLLTDAKGLVARYKVGLRTIHHWKATGRIPHIKISSRCVRYPVAECDDIILKRKVNAA